MPWINSTHYRVILGENQKTSDGEEEPRVNTNQYHSLPSKSQAAGIDANEMPPINTSQDQLLASQNQGAGIDGDEIPPINTSRDQSLPTQNQRAGRDGEEIPPINTSQDQFLPSQNQGVSIKQHSSSSSTNIETALGSFGRQGTPFSRDDRGKDDVVSECKAIAARNTSDSVEDESLVQPRIDTTVSDINNTNLLSSEVALKLDEEHIQTITETHHDNQLADRHLGLEDETNETEKHKITNSNKGSSRDAAAAVTQTSSDKAASDSPLQPKDHPGKPQAGNSPVVSAPYKMKEQKSQVSN